MPALASENHKKQKIKICNRKTILNITARACIGKAQETENRDSQWKINFKYHCQHWHREIAKNRKTRLAIEKQFKISLPALASENRKKQKNKISNRKTILNITASTGIGK